MKKIVLLFCISTLSVVSFGQCNECPVDYCFTKPEFADYCVQFDIDNDEFVMVKGKNIRTMPLSDTIDLDYFLSLATKKEYKLSAAEMLLIQESVIMWNLEKKDLGMTTTESGLKYKIFKEGNGNYPEDGQTVSVHYTGMLEDGTKFDSSVDRGEPISFVLGQGRVIKGWDEGIKLLSVGSRAILKIPSELAYGTRGAGGVIPPNAALYFEVELIEIK